MWNQSKRRNPKSRNRYRQPRVAEPASSTTESKSSHTDEGAYHEETVEDVNISNQDLNENGAPDKSDVSPPSDSEADVPSNSKDVQVPHSSSSEQGDTKNVDSPLKMSETVVFDKSPKHEQKENLILNVQDDSYNMQGSVDLVKLHVASSVKEFNSEVSESENHSEASSLIKAPRDSTNTVNEMEFSSELLKQENELDLSIQKSIETSLNEMKDSETSNSGKEDSRPILVAESQQLNISAADENEKSLSQESAIEKISSEVSDFSLKNVETCIKDEECLQSKLDSNIPNNLQNQADTNISDHEVQEDVNDQFSPLKPTLLIQTTGENDVTEIKNTVKEMIASLEICTAKNSEGQITDKASSCVDPKDFDSSKTEPKRMMLEGPESEKVVPNKRFKTGYFTETSGANVDQPVDSSALLEDEIDDSELPDLVPILESEASFTPNLEIDRVFDFLAWERVSVDIDPKLLAASLEDIDRVVITFGENVTSSTQNLFNNGPVLKDSNDSETSSDTQSSDDTSSDTSDEVNSDVTMQANEESGSDESNQKRTSASNRRIIPVESASYYDRSAHFSSSTEYPSDTTGDSIGASNRRIIPVESASFYDRSAQFSSTEHSSDTTDDSLNENNLEYEIDISRLDENPFHGVIATVRPRSVGNQERLNTTFIFMDLITAIFSYCFYIFLASFVLFVTWIRNKLRF